MPWSGCRVPCHAGAFSGLAGGVLERDDDAGLRDMLKRADYLAKSTPKSTVPVSAILAVAGVGTTGAPISGKPKVWVVVWRQDVSTRPLTVFYVSVPLCDNQVL